MRYTEDARYFQYVIECAVENEKMNGFIRTITGVNEGASYKKLDSIHEAVGDKIRSLWDKFIAFLNRIWAKFVEFTNKMIASEKDYLEKYKEIILNKKPADVDLEMRPYDEGIRRLVSNPIPAFSTVKKDIPLDSADISFKTLLIKDYTDANKDFKGYAVAYFEGGEEKKTTNLQNLHMTDLYNYCHDFEKTKAAIEKDKVTLSKTFNDASADIQKAKNPEPAKTEPPKPEGGTPPAAANNAVPTSGPGSENDPIGNPGPKKTKKINTTTNKWEYTGESSIDNYIGSYINEGDGMQIVQKQTPAAAANTSGNAAATTGDQKASANMQSVHTSKEPTVQEGDDLEELDKKIRTYNTDAGAVLAAKLTAAHVIFDDYMKLIRMHVSANVGKDGDTQVAKSGSDYRSALNLDPKDKDYYTKTIAQIEDPNNKDANAKNKLIGEINAKAKQTNPNFPGGVDAIKKALGAMK